MISIFLIYFSALNESEKITFKKIFSKYSNYMFAIALNYVKSIHDAEDIVQEASIRIMKNLSKIKDINSNETKAFISVITRNVSIDKYNSEKKLVLVEDDWPFESTEDFVWDMMDKDVLKTALKKLNEKYLHVLILGIVQGYNDEDISKILDISKENVRKRRSRALKELREILSQGGGFNG